jgi:hypothetical protein
MPNKRVLLARATGVIKAILAIPDVLLDFET